MWHIRVNSIEMHPGCTLRAMTRSPTGVMIGAGEGTRYTRCAHMMDLTFGGPRDMVASHKHGARARRTSTVYAFCTVGRASERSYR
jgi:hypothetical protein